MPNVFYIAGSKYTFLVPEMEWLYLCTPTQQRQRVCDPKIAGERVEVISVDRHSGEEIARDEKDRVS